MTSKKCSGSISSQFDLSPNVDVASLFSPNNQIDWALKTPSDNLKSASIHICGVVVVVDKNKNKNVKSIIKRVYVHVI